MTEEEQGRQKKRGRLWWALAALWFFWPCSLCRISQRQPLHQPHHKPDGRLAWPPRAPLFRARALLPTPGFVLYDLTVEEDPAFGAEPLLHASTVTASIRPALAVAGRLELSKVSVDEASLNLVRSPEGTEPRFALPDLRYKCKCRVQQQRSPRAAISLHRGTNSRVQLQEWL